MSVKFESDGNPTFSGKIVEWYKVLVSWYQQDRLPTSMGAYFETASTFICTYLEQYDPNWSKKPLFGTSNKDKARATFFLHLTSGNTGNDAGYIIKPGKEPPLQLLDFMAENADSRYLIKAEAELRAYAKQRFSKR